MANFNSRLWKGEHFIAKTSSNPSGNDWSHGGCCPSDDGRIWDINMVPIHPNGVSITSTGLVLPCPPAPMDAPSMFCDHKTGGVLPTSSSVRCVLSDTSTLLTARLDRSILDGGRFQSVISEYPNMHEAFLGDAARRVNGAEGETHKVDIPGGNSSECSDQIDDHDDGILSIGNNSRRHQSKNLVAERKRRKKLNDRLMALRSIVPNISKMNKAATLADAIEFIKALQMKVNDLQEELELTHEDRGIKQIDAARIHADVVEKNDGEKSPECSHMLTAGPGTLCSSKVKTGSPNHTRHIKSETTRVSQMEPQVEVFQVDGNECFLKILCEHKVGGFVRLMETMNSLQLEITNVNVTTFLELVSNVFRVKKSDNSVQTNQIKESLLELARNPNASLTELDAADEGGYRDSPGQSAAPNGNSQFSILYTICDHRHMVSLRNRPGILYLHWSRGHLLTCCDLVRKNQFPEGGQIWPECNCQRTPSIHWAVVMDLICCIGLTV